MNKRLLTFSIITTLGMLLVVLMGALVTNTGSGEGCGRSWPLCYGEVVPQDPGHKTIIEYSHRVVSGLMGLFVLIHSVWAWRKMNHIKWVKPLAFLSAFFVAFQGLLGAAAVIWPQSSYVLALHFGFSLISFGSVLMLTFIVIEDVTNGKAIQPRISTGMKNNLTYLIIYIYVVIYSGAFVRHTDSALGCKGWPLCNGEWIPDLYSRAGVQFIHRILAGVIIIWLLITFIRVMMRYRDESWLFWGSTIALALVMSQAFTGAMVVLTYLQLEFLLLHAFFVTSLFGTLGIMLMIASRKPK